MSESGEREQARRTCEVRQQGAIEALLHRTSKDPCQGRVLVPVGASHRAEVLRPDALTDHRRWIAVAHQEKVQGEPPGASIPVAEWVDPLEPVVDPRQAGQDVLARRGPAFTASSQPETAPALLAPADRASARPIATKTTDAAHSAQAAMVAAGGQPERRGGDRRVAGSALSRAGVLIPATTGIRWSAPGWPPRWSGGSPEECRDRPRRGVAP
jgi:hypothetical protein